MSSPRGWGEPARPSSTPQVPSGGSPTTPDPAAPDETRAMGVGELMERVVGSIRTVPRSTWLVGVAVVAVVGAIELVAARVLPFGSLTDVVLGDRVGDQEWFEQTGQEVQLLAASALTSALTAVLGAVATTLVVGWTARALALHDAGAPASVRDVWRGLRPRVPGLLVLVLLLAVVVVLALAVPALLVGLGAVTGSVGVAVVAGLLGLAAAVALLVRFVPALVVSLPSHAVADRTGAGASLRRAVALTSGERWRLVGIWLLTVIVLGITAGVIGSPFSGIGTAVGGEDAPTWSLLGSVVASAVTAPLGALVLALVHGELAQRRGTDPGRQD